MDAEGDTTCAPCPPQARFRELGEEGRGTFGVVRVAWDVAEQRTVCMKKARQGCERDLAHELGVYQSLGEHPNVARYLRTWASAGLRRDTE